MSTAIIIALITVLFSTIIGLFGYWFKMVHKEVKQVLKELTNCLHELSNMVVGIQTQIDKGIEADIRENKKNIDELFSRTNKHSNQISVLNQKNSIK